MKYPKIGQTPADGLVELTERVREVANRLLRVHEGDHPEVAGARDALAEVAARLAAIGSDAPAPRMLDEHDPRETRPYYFPGALAPRVHVAQPWMTATDEAGERRGRVRFDLIHEGPPGCVHGGHLAWFFDQAFGQHVLASAFGGPTHRLEVTYRRPTPILRELDYRVWTDRVEGRKTFLAAAIGEGETVLAEASALFVEPRSAQPASPITAR